MTMQRHELLAKITATLAEIIDNDGLKLTETTTADTVEDWDSISHVKLLIGLESDLGFEFATDEVGKAANVGGLIDLVFRKLEKA